MGRHIVLSVRSVDLCAKVDYLIGTKVDYLFGMKVSPGHRSSHVEGHSRRGAHGGLTAGRGSAAAEFPSGPGTIYSSLDALVYTVFSKFTPGGCALVSRCQRTGARLCEIRSACPFPNWANCGVERGNSKGPFPPCGESVVTPHGIRRESASLLSLGQDPSNQISQDKDGVSFSNGEGAQQNPIRLIWAPSHACDSGMTLSQFPLSSILVLCLSLARDASA